MKNRLVFFSALTLFSFESVAQLLTVETASNTLCNSAPCDYQGPTILINELMISPAIDDGSIIGPVPSGGGRAEWIELFNPDICNSVDISCYYLGNSTFEGAGGFRIPENTIVPPAGFAVVRGVNAPPVPVANLVQNGGNVVEIVAPAEVDMLGACYVNGFTNRIWFPNIGGWFAFYDENGVPQDAVSWGEIVFLIDDLAGNPCAASRPGCPNLTNLPSYNQIPSNLKTQVTTIDASFHIDQSIRRIPDGGAWSGTGAPTYGACNAACTNLNQTVCNGSATVSQAPGIGPYQYQWNDVNNQTTSTATGLCAGTYSVTVTSSDGIVSTQSITIEDFSPSVNFNWNDTLCLNSGAVPIVNFTPSPTINQQGVFSGPGVNQNQFVPALAGLGIHTLVYNFTDENGCQNIAETIVMVVDVPALTLDVPAELCFDAPPAEIMFSPPNGSLTGPGVQGVSFVPSLAGVGLHDITYTYTDPVGCSNSISAPVVVNPLPVLQVGAPLSFCINDSPSPLNVSPSGGVLTYLGNELSLFDPVSFGVGSHPINFSLTDANGCSNATEFEVIVQELPEIAINLTNVEGCAPLLFTFQAETTNASSCVWDFGDGQTLSNCDSFSYSFSSPGCYSPTLIASNDFGCFSDTTLIDLVCVLQEPIAAFVYNPSASTAVNTTVNFVNQSLNADNYVWSIDLNNTVFTSAESNLLYTFPNGVEGQYPVTLLATSADGCTDSTTQVITVSSDVSLYVPNTFTPDDDQFNQTWFVYINGIDVSYFNLLLFNRWGELIWESRNPEIGWDGIYSGKPVPDGVYSWTITAKSSYNSERFVWNGHLNVLR